MAYKTGDMAKIVGLTSQTLREYEKVGLLEAEKDPESGYRYFNSLMVSKAIAIRSLRNLGFSLPEVQRLLEKMNYEEYCDYFNEMLRRQEKALERQKLLCRYAREQTELFCHLEEVCHQCSVEENISIYCLDYMQGEKPLLKTKKDLAIMDQWTNASLFTRNYSPMSPADPDRKIMGLAVLAQDAELLGLPLDAPVYSRNADCVITMMARHLTSELPGEEEVRYVMEFAEKNRLVIQGDPFMVSRISYWEDDVEISYSMLYYPVKSS